MFNGPSASCDGVVLVFDPLLLRETKRYQTVGEYMVDIIKKYGIAYLTDLNVFSFFFPSYAHLFRVMKQSHRMTLRRWSNTHRIYVFLHTYPPAELWDWGFVPLPRCFASC